MRTYFIFLGLLLSLMAGCKYKRSTAPQLPSLTKEEALKDIDVFCSILKRAHPSPFLYISNEAFNATADSIGKKIGDRISILAFYDQLYFLSNKIGCSHTDLALPKHLYDSLQYESLFFPYPVEWIDNKLLVNVTGYELSEGTEIREINNVPVKQILDSIMPYNAIEGRSRETQRFIASRDFSFNYFIRYNAPKKFRLSIADTTGMEKMVEEMPVSLSEWSDRSLDHTYYFDDISVDYDLTVNEEFGYALMRVSTFDFTTTRKQMAFENFCKNSFELLRSKPKIKSLIVDIRENLGGNLFDAALLFSYLAKKPFPQYGAVSTRMNQIPFEQFLSDDFSAEKKNEINEIIGNKFVRRKGANGFWYIDSFITKWVPDPSAFRGKVFVITNAKVTSAASYFALMVKNAGVGKIVGEETAGGSYSGNGFDFVKYELPNSGIRVNFPYAHIIYNYPDSVNRGRGVIPDYKIPATTNSFKDNRDNQVFFIVDSLISQTYQSTQ